MVEPRRVRAGPLDSISLNVAAQGLLLITIGITLVFVLTYVGIQGKIYDQQRDDLNQIKYTLKSEIPLLTIRASENNLYTWLIVAFFVQAIGVFATLKGNATFLVTYALVLIAHLVYQLIDTRNSTTSGHSISLNPLLLILNAALALLYANLVKQDSKAEDEKSSANSA